VLSSKEDDRVPCNQFLLVHKRAPPSSQQMPPWCPSVNMPELPYLAMHIFSNHSLHRGIHGVIQPWKYRLCTVSRHRETSTIVSIRLSKCLCKRSRFLCVIAIIIITSTHFLSEVDLVFWKWFKTNL